MPELPELLALLRSQRWLLLLGCPGSGKTWTARQLAREAIAQENYQQSFAQLSVPEQDLLDHFSGPVRRAQLHPAWSYELFIEGLRPEIVQGQASAVLRDGVFKRFCRDASARPQLSWSLILDDVHRCEIGQLFGESQQLLETPEDRVWLPGSGDSLQLTRRAMLIATSQRRDLARLDPAWLRHFAVVELPPDYSVLPKLAMGAQMFSAGSWLSELNVRLSRLLGPLAVGEWLGQGYFFFDGRPPADFAAWQQRLRYQIWPRLQQLSQQFGFSLQDLIGSVDPASPDLAQDLEAEFPQAFE
ncbi:MAG: AAA family ATPase [Candidatus Sericytochromatia bacterium]